MSSLGGAFVPLVLSIPIMLAGKNSGEYPTGILPHYIEEW